MASLEEDKGPRKRRRSRSPPRRQTHERHHHPRHRSRSRSRSRPRPPPSSAVAHSHRKTPSSGNHAELVRQAALLPAAQHREELLHALAEHQVVICVGETGSGKSTQIPQYLHACGAYTRRETSDSTSKTSAACIAVTQPRRVATVAVAQRVAKELNTTVGGDGVVGYAIRFEARGGPNTRIKFLTDGVLVRECLRDPLLRRYSVVMLDEAHERSIHTDLLFGLLKQVVAQRRDFRLLVTSATLDAERFSTFFSGSKRPIASQDKHMLKQKTKKKKKETPCPVVRIPGRVFPVDIFHSKQKQIMGRKGPISTYVRAAVETALQVHNSEPPGHILVFLTGQQEIEDACAQLRQLHQQQLSQESQENQPNSHMTLRVLPLYGSLPSHRQREIFDPVPIERVRKLIVATNIAESALTVDGVRYVVDCGFTKQKVYDPSRQMEALVVLPVSKDSAQQRAGRAGRTAPGKCFRLYSKASYELLAPETVPEIQRTNLANTVLYLKVLGISDVLGFAYLDPPDEDALLDALQQLVQLGALAADSGDVTPMGRLMAAFPLEPKLSRALAEALRLGCDQEMTRIVAMLSVENVFLNQRRQEEDDGQEMDWERRMRTLRDAGLLSELGDQLTYAAILEAFEAVKGGRQELRRWCEARQLRLRALTAARAVAQQLRDIVDALPHHELDEARRIAASSDSENKHQDATLSDRLRRSLCAGFFMNAARRCATQTVYRLLDEEASDAAKTMQLAQLHPLSVLQLAAPPEYCVFQELVSTSRAFLRDVLAVERRWLEHYTQKSCRLGRDQLFALCGRVSAQEEKTEVELETPKKREKPAQVDNDAIAAARARFLARKKRA